MFVSPIQSFGNIALFLICVKNNVGATFFAVVQHAWFDAVEVADDDIRQMTLLNQAICGAIQRNNLRVVIETSLKIELFWPLAVCDDEDPSHVSTISR